MMTPGPSGPAPPTPPPAADSCATPTDASVTFAHAPAWNAPIDPSFSWNQHIIHFVYCEEGTSYTQ